ncbi:Endomembrane protein 70-like protein [Penicillium waksmanii]|uniref:Endomembrane protein 70-like protein n=1 Tax=Penicillium waksmanii TaxID=69791 RepID=UPI002548EE38|nr:Endomembrane protein 70-like protein [Penicillium waksmanii]KAJ5979886.1 Endomembrane protein 70-like protein [Penicillium waksmanii]
MAAVAIHHLQPPPLALFSISGILTFQHPFFNSSIKLDQNLAQADITPYLSGAVTVGYNPAYDEWAFDPEMLTPSSSMRNHNYVRPTKPATMSSTDARSYQRRKLYEFFVNKNMYVEMVEGVDLGFDWATERHNKWNDWPPTIIVQGDNDDDVNKDVAIYVAKLLGEKAKLFLAERKGHMFEATAFLDDEVEGLDVVRRAARELENVIERSNYPGLV